MFNKTLVAKRIILNSAVTETQWQKSFYILPMIHMLSCNDQHRWRELTIFFMYHKSFTGAGGLIVTEQVMLLIALQTCFPIHHRSDRQRLCRHLDR